MMAAVGLPSRSARSRHAHRARSGFHGELLKLGIAIGQTSVSSPIATTKPGSSPGADIVPQPKVRADQCRLDQNATADLKLAA
jgi:hypothetical protein